MPCLVLREDVLEAMLGMLISPLTLTRLSGSRVGIIAYQAARTQQSGKFPVSRIG